MQHIGDADTSGNLHAVEDIEGRVTVHTAVVFGASVSKPRMPDRRSVEAACAKWVFWRVTARSFAPVPTGGSTVFSHWPCGSRIGTTSSKPLPMASSRKLPQIEVQELTDDKIVFKLTNCDTSLANALRRVLISEVSPSGAETIVALCRA